MTIVALIPARMGSRRIPGKNTRPLAGWPLIAYTIRAAQQSGIFTDVAVCSDDSVAVAMGVAAGCSAVRRARSGDDEPDIVWVRQALRELTPRVPYDAFAILRPTSPFRTAATMQRAWAQFQTADADSLRAVEVWRGPSPYKMWHVHDDRMMPILRAENADLVPQHSCPTQTLPLVYVQNASLEIAWTSVVSDTRTISGFQIAPFITEGHEGFDLNTEDDWQQAEALIASGAAVLPSIETLVR